MDRSIIFALIFIVLVALVYYFWQEHEAGMILNREQSAITVETPVPVPEVAEKKEIQYPVPLQASDRPDKNQTQALNQAVAEAFHLPALDESDGILQLVFARLYQVMDVAEIFRFNDFVRHIVVTIDNLTNKKLPQRFVFTQSPEAKFSVRKSTVENEFYLDRLNFDRYRRFMDFADVVDNRELVSVYLRYYPLFQEAYEELGYPGQYFNDRLIEVIDHLLQTPAVASPVKLLQPKVYYLFADPDLESLSAGQKILIRMGPDNTAKVKLRLRDLRRILTTLEP